MDVLKANGIDRLVDLRERPYSRKAGFSSRQLTQALKGAGIGYTWMGKLLGGFSISREQWLMGCQQVAEMAKKETIVMMCMEADWNQCHRKKLAEILASEHKIHNINL